MEKSIDDELMELVAQLTDEQKQMVLDVIKALLKLQDDFKAGLLTREQYDEESARVLDF